MRAKGNQILLKGLPIPKGYTGQATDFSIFKWSPKSKIALYVLDPKFVNLPSAIIREVEVSTNAIGMVILNEGEMLAVVLEKPDGRTKLSFSITGEIMKLDNKREGK